MATDSHIAPLTSAAVDQLGGRLRIAMSVDDLRLLDQYRREFREDYETVVAVVRDQLGLVPSGRPAKSTAAILDKLKRSTMRLSQMQDVAGCRVVVSDVRAQDDAVGRLTTLLSATTVFDRRDKPSHGYRAVHVVARPRGRPIEIQVRTELQHSWAELSEKWADSFGVAVKYGGGPKEIRTMLDGVSDLVANFEGVNWGAELADEVAKLHKGIAAHLAEYIDIAKGQS